MKLAYLRLHGCLLRIIERSSERNLNHLIAEKKLFIHTFPQLWNHDSTTRRLFQALKDISQFINMYT